MINHKSLVQLYRTNKLTPSFTRDETEATREALLGWYDSHRRQLPWRGDILQDRPHIPPSAYGTWISEIMLQQTRVETVIAYWFRWMERFPTIQVLAGASAEEVNVLWAGLGYYRRAAQILACAKLLVAEYNSELPDLKEDLLKLPGIGPYTAGAISSIAFGHVTGLVDGNVIRVLSRLRAIDTQTGAAMDKVCWQLVEPLVDPGRPGHFNQALMELGATVCKPTSPACSDCPVRSLCHAYSLTHLPSSPVQTKKRISSQMSQTSEDLADIEDLVVPLPLDVTDFPKKTPKKPPKDLLFAVSVLKIFPASDTKTDSAAKYLFVRRPAKGLLQNQWEFPTALQPPDAIPANYDTFSLEKKTKSWLPVHNAFLENTFGIQVEEWAGQQCQQRQARGGSEGAGGGACAHLRLFPEEYRLHPEPVVHIFSHQKHTMHILEASCRAECFISLNEKINIFDSWETNEENSREVAWLSLAELREKGITTGVQKIISLITNVNKEKKITVKSDNDNVTESSRKTKSINRGDEDSAIESTKLRKISDFFKKK